MAGLVAIVVLVLGVGGCQKSGRMDDGASPASPKSAPARAPVSALAPVAVVPPDGEAEAAMPGSWEKAAEEGTWIMHGSDAPPLVVRGTLRPIHTSSNIGGCIELLGARHGTTPLTLKIEGRPKTLYVYAKARGPIGISSGSYCESASIAGANKWARYEIANAGSEVTIPIVDVDVPGERSGQTSPYVVVVSEKDEEPKLEPESRPAVAETDLLVRWSVKHRDCAPGLSLSRCYAATITITDAKGNAVATMPLKAGLVGQLGCWPEDTCAHCGGPSGMTRIVVEAGKDASGKPNGTVTVATASQSDGYCEPNEDCTSRTVLGKMRVPPGRRLIPDPNGVWSP